MPGKSCLILHVEIQRGQRGFSYFWFFNFENISELNNVDVKKEENITTDGQDLSDEESPKISTKHNMAFKDLDNLELEVTFF